MIKDSKTESLVAALSFFLLKELPDSDDGENIWIKALALAKKRDGSESYVYVVKDKDTLENRVAKDFGAISQIVEIIEYYPFSFLNAAYIPEFNGNKKDDRIKYLMAYDNSKDYSAMTLKELNKEVIRVGIVKQLNDEKNRRR